MRLEKILGGLGMSFELIENGKLRMENGELEKQNGELEKKMGN
jgi:hypothetical protein